MLHFVIFILPIVNYMKVWRCAGSLKTDDSRTVPEAESGGQPSKRDLFSLGGTVPATTSGGGLGLGLVTKFSKKGTIQLPNQVPLH